MPVHYFDTCALKHRYIDSPKSRVVRRAITDRRNECFVLELTVLEITSPIGAHCRGHGLGPAVFDRMDRAVMRDVANGKLGVRSFTRADLQRARHLMRYAGVCKGRALGSADALIAVGALELALERGVQVTFWLDDWPMYSIVRGLDAFKALRLRYLGRVR